MPKEKNFGHTVVQHSAWGYKKDGRFAAGLESREIQTLDQLLNVRRAGGLVFQSYGEAEEYARREAYPPEVKGLIPRAPGKFSARCIDGLAIYLPVSVASGESKP